MLYLLQNEGNNAETEQQPLFQPVVASAEATNTTVIVPTGPQIIQVPIVTSNVAQPPASFIILQPQCPIQTMQQQPLYLPNGMVHFTSSQPLPQTIPTFQPQFTTILPTYICTQDAMASTQPQFSSVNFS